MKAVEGVNYAYSVSEMNPDVKQKQPPMTELIARRGGSFQEHKKATRIVWLLCDGGKLRQGQKKQLPTIMTTTSSNHNVFQ